MSPCPPMIVIVPPFMVLYWGPWSHVLDPRGGGSPGGEARFLQQNLHLLGQTQRTVYWFWVAQAWVSTSQEEDIFTDSSRPSRRGLAGLALSYAMSMPRDLMYLSRRWASMEVEFVSIVERIMEYARLRTEQEADGTEAAPSPGAFARAPASVAVFAQAL
ncbi:ATP-dependent bile acid permease [Symbiodinium microadriaticum]|uniref:ATP-dependent bile acid permease n=1 Tax=Symbiodinium microadriaticum TaxID=2951 RepID=A0A1Q9E0G8_SYMMI|nr:ATP-dependent bile acid permease [Symbiodinium microadriaticum]